MEGQPAQPAADPGRRRVLAGLGVLAVGAAGGTVAIARLAGPGEPPPSTPPPLTTRTPPTAAARGSALAAPTPTAPPSTTVSAGTGPTDRPPPSERARR